MSVLLLATLLFLVPGAGDDEVLSEDLPEGEPAQVAFFDLHAKDGVTKKQAKGISIMLREALGTIGAIELKDKRKDDKKTNRKCNLKPKCLGKAAFSRGADSLLTGTLHTSEEGFEVRLDVILQREIEVDREVEGLLSGGTAAMEASMDRMLREAVAPLTLTGALRVGGAPKGAKVLIDGRLAGTLPVERLEGLLEGTYTVDVEKEGYTSATRRVDVHYKELSTLEVTLIPTSRARKHQDEIAQGKEEASKAWVFAIPASIGIVAAASLGTGIAFGVLTQREADDVNARAKAGMLLFPDDAEILQRGETYSLVANLSYVVTAVTIAAALGTTGFLLLPEQTEEEEAEAFSATGKKDYDDAETQPALEGL
ncbi:MAG: PEGA domain-containing protein [Deltaproteobacteria bacterium]|nr:PEGA domain-containing protein [Deltaproteobacteria bacterium]